MKYRMLIVVMLGMMGWGMMGWGQVQPRGSEQTFDLVTWNIENFPMHGQATVDTVRSIIIALQVDMIAVEEIADTVAFRNLVNSIEDWEGVYSADEYGPGNYQKTGILYRTDQIQLMNVGQLFNNEWYAFPRPPLMARVVFERGTQQFDFHLIVVHLKAGGGSEDLARRREACQMLRAFITEAINQGEDPDFIVAGDFNDEIDDPPQYNSFTVFLDDSLHYQFLTMPLAGDPYWASYPSYNSLIDHVLVTIDVLGEYEGGDTRTLRLDYEVLNYTYWVSDHRPVFSMFPVAESGVKGGGEGQVPETTRLVSMYPNPFNSRVAVEYEVMAPGEVTVRVYNVQGQLVRELWRGMREAGRYQVFWDGIDNGGNNASSGVYFVRLESGLERCVSKILFIR